MKLKDAPSRARRRISAGDTIISTVRPQLRCVAHFPFPSANLIASTGFTVLSPKDGVDGSFLFQTVLRNEFFEHLVQRQRGSNYPAVRPLDIAEARLVLPPLSEQKRLAAILSSVDGTIEDRSRY